MQADQEGQRHEPPGHPGLSRDHAQARRESRAGEPHQREFPGGKLAAVIPASAHGKFHVEGLNVVYDGPYNNQFSGTSTSVTIMVGEKA